jgi:hypothetical protein
VLPVSTYLVLPVSTTRAIQSPRQLQTLTGEGLNAMKHQALRWLRVSLGLLLFAAGGGQPGGFDLMAQQVQVMGARQWLGLMAGAAIAPVSQRIAGTLPRQQS